MFNKFILFSNTILFLNCITLFGQIQRNTGQITGAAYSGSAIESFSIYKNGDSKDNYYLNETWSIGSIDLFNGDKYELLNVPIKFDIINNRLEIKFEDVVKVVDLKLVNTLKLFDPSKGKNLTFENGVTISGLKHSLYESLSKDSDYSVFKKYYSIKLPADYNPQFDIGSRSETILIKSQYYIYAEKDKQLTELKISTSEVKKLFKNNKEIIQVIKQNKLKIKSEKELIYAFNLINSSVRK